MALSVKNESEQDNTLLKDPSIPPASSFVQDEGLPPSQAQLLSLYQSIPDTVKEIPVGIMISVPPGWYSYWKNPGDTGKSLTVEWESPKGAKASPLLFPLPERLYTAPYHNFIYDKDYVVLTTLHVRDSVKDKASSLTLSLKVDWFLCKSMCIPFSKTLTKTIPYGTVQNLVDPHVAALFKEAKKKLPVFSSVKGHLDFPEDSKTIKASVSVPSELEGFKLVDVFPISEEKPLFSNSPPQIANASSLNGKKQDQHLEFTVNRASHLGLKQRALLVFKAEDQVSGVEVSFHTPFHFSSNLIALLLAFLGGIILNFMPCVLPLIFLKLSYTLDMKGKAPHLIVLSNVFYCGGILLSFWILAFILFGLKSGGESLGWGFQMHSLPFLYSLILVFTLLSFNFMGWFHVDLSRIPGLKKINISYWLLKPHLLKHFVAGLLSTWAASPCTAPFMGVALAYAFSTSAFNTFLVFTFLGLGLAFPYLILSIFPEWVEKLPSPGSWSNTLKHFFVFPLLGTVAWLIHLLVKGDDTYLLPVLMCLLGLSLGFWLWKNTRLFVLRGGAVFLILLMALGPLGYFSRTGMYVDEGQKIFWKDFSLKKTKELSGSKEGVFVNFTADWCLTCQLNDYTTFKNEEVIQYFKDRKVIALKGDWTRPNTEIAGTLKQYQRVGIPFYLYIPPHNSEPVLLPELLSPKTVMDTLSQHTHKTEHY